jgi:hypothetical protein
LPKKPLIIVRPIVVITALLVRGIQLIKRGSELVHGRNPQTSDARDHPREVGYSSLQHLRRTNRIFADHQNNSTGLEYPL